MKEAWFHSDAIRALESLRDLPDSPSRYLYPGKSVAGGIEDILGYINYLEDSLRKASSEFRRASDEVLRMDTALASSQAELAGLKDIGKS